MTRLFWASVAAYAAAWLVAALALPDRVPLHFGVSGEPDRWGSRSAALLTFWLIGVGIAALFWWLLHRLPRGDLRHVNVPHKQWWLTNRPDELRRLVGRDLRLIAVATMLLLTVVLAGVVSAARAEQPALPIWATFVVVGYVACLIAWGVHATLVRYRPAAGP